MANFKDWALQYVLSDDEPTQRDIVGKAAKEIEASRASSIVVGNWAASVQPWMTTAQASDDFQMDDGDDTGSGDIIARAKALGFLAGTLEVLDRNILRADQVLRLIGFFGALFSYDHKAGITASSKALRYLCDMKTFKPDMGAKVIEDVCKIKEDFRLQTAATRLEIYELFLRLIEDKAVSSELQHKYGASCGFVIDLLQLFQHERDPQNLLVWFKIIAILLKDLEPSTEVTEEIFKAFSAYFPISLRTSASATGITAEDLKSAVRGCFASHQRIATLAFQFLMQKLDQGDAVTVAVKVDILKTIKACIDEYEHPQTSIIPHIEKIWNSLKYEVRNGEVKETINATLDVLRSIANKLDGTSTQRFEVSMLKNYIDLMFKDCRDDLSNPTYTKQAGLLLMTVITTNIRAYTLENSSFIESIRQNLRQPKSPSHTKDLLLLLNSLLKARLELVKNRKQGRPEDEEQLRAESRTNLDTLFHDVYLPMWTKKISESNSEDVDILKQVIQGLALLVSQHVVQSGGQVALLHNGTICSEICSLLTQSLTKGLSLSSNDNVSNDAALEDEAVLALRSIVANYTEGYVELASRAKAEIRKRDWTNPSKYSLNALKDLVSRFAFIGCSEIPSNIALETPTPKQFSPLQHFITLAATLLDLFPISSPPGSARFDGPVKESLANSYVISALHAGILNFRDACEVRYQQAVLTSYSTSDKNWLDEFGQLPENWLQQLQVGDGFSDDIIYSISENDPEVYRQFLRLSLFVVRHLYRAASTRSPTPWSERIRAQVANIASLVVRSLDEQLQISCNLAQEAFGFFNSQETESTQQNPSKPLTELLTLGILEGLWPGAMLGLYEPGGVAESFMCDISNLGPFPSRVCEIRAAIGAILANKYKGGPSTSDPQFQTLKRMLEFWGNQIKEATSSIEADSDTFGALSTIAMYIFAGAAARQDMNVLDRVPVLQAAIASQHHNGETVAQSMGILVNVRDNGLLTAENHAVVRRFYKQWVYSNLVKPMYTLAVPTETGSLAATRFTTAILSIVTNCPFTVYEDDLEPLIRLLITTFTNRAGLSKDVSRSQVVSALEILAEILVNEPESIKSHLRAIIGGAMNVYQESCQESQDKFKYTVKAASRTSDYNLVMCRKQALQLLGAIPKKFEERHLLPYSLQLQRMLSTASGDPVREVRRAALLARQNWTNIV